MHRVGLATVGGGILGVTNSNCAQYPLLRVEESDIISLGAEILRTSDDL